MCFQVPGCFNGLYFDTISVEPSELKKISCKVKIERKLNKIDKVIEFLLNFMEVIGADRKIVHCVWLVDEDVLFNETWIDEN